MRKMILNSTLISLLVVMSIGCSFTGNKKLPFEVKEELFDQSEADDLGLKTIQGTETVSIFTPNDTTDHYSNGAVMTAFGGMLYCQWQSSATDEDSEDTWVAYSSSADGISWTAPMVLAASPANGICTSGGWWQHGGRLVAFVNVWEASTSPKGGSAYYRTTSDGKNWSELKPVTMLDGSAMKGVFEQDPHALPGGRIVNAIHFQPGILVSPAYTDDPSGTSGWVKASFTPTPYKKDVTNEIEPSWFRNGDSLIMTFRDQNSSYRKMASVSTDRGENWTTPVPTNMPDSRSKQSNGNFFGGGAFMVSNPTVSKRRVPLAITISKNGYYFDRAFLLRSGGEDLQNQRYPGKYKSIGYHYPKSMVHDGYLYVAYTTNKEDVQYTRIAVDSILTAK